MIAPAPSRTARLARLAAELTALVQVAEQVQLDSCSLAAVTAQVERDIEHLRELIGGAR